MTVANSGPLRYSRGSRLRDSHPQQFQVQDFASFVAAIDSDRAKHKASAAYFCGPLNGDGRRCAIGSLPTRWVAVDLDRIDAEVLADVRLWFTSYSACGWSTHSSKPEAPRERVIIELDREATRDECIAIGETLTRDLTEKFAESVQIDKCTFRPEQPVFVPPTGAEMIRFDGAPFAVERALGKPARSASPTEEAQTMTEVILLSPSVRLLSSSVGIPLDTLPSDIEQRNACLFRLARHVKRCIPDATRDDLRPIVKRWHELALPNIRTTDFAVTFADFMRGFERVKQPFGVEMDAIVANIENMPLPPAVESLGYGDAGIRLVRICAALQSHHGDEPFFLSARQAGELLGMHFTDSNKMLATLVQDGVIELVFRGVGKMASRYRFALA